MSLDALGDAHFVRKDGERLVTSVQLGSLKTVEGILLQNTRGFFYNHADSALIHACNGLSKEKMVDVLLGYPPFTSSLSYCGLILAREAAEKSGNEDISLKIAEVLDKREKQIQETKILGYLEEIKLRTVCDGIGGEQMLGNPADVIAFAVETSDMLALLALAESGTHEFLDKGTLNFIQKRIEKKKNLVDKAVLLYIVGNMVGQKHTDEQLKSIETNVSSIKNSISSLRRSDGKNKMRSTS